jgi:hypothetical protein
MAAFTRVCDALWRRLRASATRYGGMPEHRASRHAFPGLRRDAPRLHPGYIRLPRIFATPVEKAVHAVSHSTTVWPRSAL